MARTAHGAEPVEIEVKLGVSRPRRVRRLLRAPEGEQLAGFRPVGAAHLVRVTDRYLDTDETAGRLATARMRVRLRLSRRAVTLALKRSGLEQAGVTTRVELEAPATRSLDPRRWPDSAAKRALLEAVGERPLREVARLRQDRLTRRFRRASTTVELSLDALEALDDGQVIARRHELEAELVRGNASDLAELAVALSQFDGIGPALGSKLLFAVEARRDARDTPAGRRRAGLASAQRQAPDR
jgi:inorganic triphosphatase YgiF